MNSSGQVSTGPMTTHGWTSLKFRLTEPDEQTMQPVATLWIYMAAGTAVGQELSTTAQNAFALALLKDYASKSQ